MCSTRNLFVLNLVTVDNILSSFLHLCLIHFLKLVHRHTPSCGTPKRWLLCHIMIACESSFSCRQFLKAGPLWGGTETWIPALQHLEGACLHLLISDWPRFTLVLEYPLMRCVGSVAARLLICSRMRVVMISNPGVVFRNVWLEMPPPPPSKIWLVPGSLQSHFFHTPRSLWALPALLGV